MTAPLAFSVDATIDDAAVRKALALAPAATEQELEQAFRDIVADFGLKYVRRRLQLNRGGSVLFRNPTPGGASGVLQQRSSFLLNSFGQRVVRGNGDINRVAGYVGFGPPAAPWAGPAQVYIRLQEEGGVIRPKGHPFLAIPAEANLTLAGVPRLHSPKQLPNAVFRINRARTGGVVLDGPQGAVMFYLTKEVRIPPRLNLHHDWTEYVREGIPRKRVGLGIRRALDRAAAGGH